MSDTTGKAWPAAGLLRLGLPLGVSLLIHAVLFALLVGVAWTFAGPRRGGEVGPPVLITLPSVAAPPPAPAAGASAPGVSPGPSPGRDVPPPALSGLSNTAAAPPVLRSAIGEGAVPLLRPGAVHVGGATFAGLGARRARSVVYVVDASGAMVTNIKWIKDELQRSIAALAPTQQFQVVLFRDRTGTSGDGLFEIFRSEDGSLLPATATNKQALGAWLADIQPTGRSNPVDGLRRALDLRPDAVFLLSRGIRRTGGREDDPPGGLWGRGADAILAELEALNPRLREGGPRTVVIKTIQFLEEDPTGIMRAIAEAHGDGTGSYRVVTPQDLGIR